MAPLGKKPQPRYRLTNDDLLYGGQTPASLNDDSAVARFFRPDKRMVGVLTGVHVGSNVTRKLPEGVHAQPRFKTPMPYYKFLEKLEKGGKR